jgi:hypothetical protein
VNAAKAMVCYASYSNDYYNVKSSVSGVLAQPNACITQDVGTGMPKLQATKHIKKGQEIFITYGDNYKF